MITRTLASAALACLVAVVENIELFQPLKNGFLQAKAGVQIVVLDTPVSREVL